MARPESLNRSHAGRGVCASSIVSALLLFGCAGGPPKQAGAEDDFGASRSAGEAASASASADVDAPPPSSDSAPTHGDGPDARLNKEQKEQIQIALKRGATKAVQCPDVVPNAPTGEGEVRVTFDGKKGRSIDATVGAPFAGTPIEACIKRAFIDEIIVPFDGATIEMPTTVKLAAKAPADDKGKKPKK